MSGYPNDLSAFTYEYSPEQIAYFPTPKRTASKLLVVRRDPSGGLPRFEDLRFEDLPSLLEDNPLLRNALWVRNRSRVLKARLFAKRVSGGRHEIVLLERVSEKEWTALIRNVSKIKFPELLQIENSHEKIEVIAPDSVRFIAERPLEIIETRGRIPLPPYIERETDITDSERYQSVWATGEAKSSAAPTASLHFTEELWSQLSNSGIKSADVFLHVGRGTFEPLRERDLSKAKLHQENFEVIQSEAQKIWDAKEVLAIGTTACRLTEFLAHDDKNIILQKGMLRGKCDLFIKPGYEFQKVRALLTNFHLPESSLFVLVSVFAGSLGLAREAYTYALKRGYRLFSYGDSSIWL